MLVTPETIFSIIFAIFGSAAEEPKIETAPTVEVEPVSCRLEVSDNKPQRMLVATIIGGNFEWSGEFRLTVESQGANKMNIHQGGDVQVGAHETSHVARIALGSGAEDAVNARMQLSWEKGGVQCEIDRLSNRI